MIGILKGVKYGKITATDEAQISSNAWGVWAALCMFCDWQCSRRGLPIQSKAGTCYPSTAQLAIRAHMSPRAVTYAIRELEAAGYVRTEARPGYKNQYTLYPMRNAPTVVSATTAEEDRQYALTAIRNIAYGGVKDDPTCPDDTDISTETAISVD